MPRQARAIIFTNLFGAFHYFLTLYIVSSFLAQYMGESLVGLVFSAGALVSLSLFLGAPKILKHVPLKRFAQVLGLVQFAVLVGLAIFSNVSVVVPLVILLLALAPVIGYTPDIFLEQSMTSEAETAKVRGFFMGVMSLAIVLSPLAVGYILGDSSLYGRIFVAAAASFLPFIIFLSAFMKNPPIEREEKPSIRSTIRCLVHSKDVVLGVSAHFVMLLFFSWAAIYIPLYLHTGLGISWAELGWVFSLMLLPYLLLEVPIGVLADKYFGEREIMMGGFAIIGLSLALISFITTPEVGLFLIFILIFTRVGAAMAEITTESYFFKHVDGRDVNSITLFRAIRPASSLIAPLIGSAVLLFTSLQSLFIVLGGLCLLGIPLAFFLRDTR